MKKNVFLLLIFYFLTSLLPAQNFANSNQSLNVISFNIRYDNPGDGENSWPNRKEHVVSLLRFHDAEIFCLQEALISQIRDLEFEFPDFEYYGPCRDDGKEKGEACPVFFRKDLFLMEDSGTFWYSETPDQPGSIDWKANLPRIASWVKLKVIVSNQEVIVVSTHFDHESQLSRNNSARLLKNKLNEIASDLPVIICGDFNDRPESETYRELTSKNSGLVLLDSRSVSEQIHHGPGFTYTGFDFEGTNGDIIDYVFINNRFNVIRTAYLTDNRNCIFPSDHLPVFVELKYLEQ
jgi:endonuclease/exonuclease/phosphatase family metal-dependent hydrolase